MTSKVVKCPTCNIVINEVLAFVSNKIDVVTEETISRVCISAFSETDILEAKNLLFDSITTITRNIHRKGCRKTLREIDDIIWMFKNTTAEERPIFVARDLHKLPPLLFEHLDVTKLLKDILLVRQEVVSLREQSATVQQLDLLKKEVDSIKTKSAIKISNISMQRNVNKRRGAFVGDYELNSGPIGLPPMSNDGDIAGSFDVSWLECDGQNTYRDIEQPLHQLVKNNTMEPPEPSITSPYLGQASRSAENSINELVCNVSNDNTVMSHSPRTGRSPEPGALTSLRACTRVAAITKQSPPAAAQAAHSGKITASEVNNEAIGLTKEITMADIVRGGEFKRETRDSEWTLVQKNKLRNRFVGNRGNAKISAHEKFKAADIRTPIYIYGVAKTVSVEDILSYVENKSGLNVAVIQMKMKLLKEYSAFKIFVPKHKLDIFMNDEFWPAGIAYRRFYDFSHSKLNTVKSSTMRPLNVTND